MDKIGSICQKIFFAAREVDAKVGNIANFLFIANTLLCRQNLDYFLYCSPE